MLRILAKQLAQRVKVALAYRLDLLATVVNNLLIASVGLVFVGALLRHVPALGAWKPAEILFCWGFAEAGVGLFYVLFGGLFVVNHRYILGGELDRALLRPVDPLAQVLVENVSLEDVPVLGLGLAVMAYAATGLDPVPAWRWALLPVLLLAAACVLGGLLTGLASLGFHLRHRGTGVGLVTQLSIFNRYPLDLFAAPLRWGLTFAVPLAFAGFYPASLFLGDDRWLPWALAQPLVGAACLVAGRLAWVSGMRGYSSTGS